MKTEELWDIWARTGEYCYVSHIMVGCGNARENYGAGRTITLVESL